MATVWFNTLEAIQPDCPPPAITSTPLTTVAVDEAYTYDVDAMGEPAPTYSLTIAPSGMSIDPATGIISWTPTENQRGSHAVEVEATNFYGTDTQAFAVTVPHELFLPAIQSQ
jgi:hypothetical protein